VKSGGLRGWYERFFRVCHERFFRVAPDAGSTAGIHFIAFKSFIFKELGSKNTGSFAQAAP
jgi:hypothetical protein